MLYVLRIKGDIAILCMDVNVVVLRINENVFVLCVYYSRPEDYTNIYRYFMFNLWYVFECDFVLVVNFVFETSLRPYWKKERKTKSWCNSIKLHLYFSFFDRCTATIVNIKSMSLEHNYLYLFNYLILHCGS
jgi:hypothetical protein